jgi:hypothetical protein
MPTSPPGSLTPYKGHLAKKSNDVELGEFFATLIALGFGFTADVRDILEERFKSEEEPSECIRALKAIGDLRTFPLPVYRDWKSMLIQRFGADTVKTCKIGVQVDQELTKREQMERREKHQALILMRSIEQGDPGWHSRLDEWLQKVKESYRIGFQKVYDRWLHIRKNMLRDGPCRKGTIEIFFHEPCGDHWRIARLKCTEPYRPEVLFEEIKSWLQNDVYDTSDWEIFDEDGRVDITSQREPRDGERYIVLSPEVSEELRGSMNARFKKFLQTTRWRRIKSRYKIEVFEEQTELPGFETVEEAIHRKHVRYRTRWKQRRRILAQPEESSPLCAEFTPSDAGQLQDQIQAPTVSGWQSVGSDVESNHARRSRNCRAYLEWDEQKRPRSFKIQPSYPGPLSSRRSLNERMHFWSFPIGNCVSCECRP